MTLILSCELLFPVFFNPLLLITAGTPTTTTTDTLHRLPLLQVRFRHTTYARAVEVRFLGLNAPQAAQMFVALLLPFRYQHSICVIVLE